MQSAALRLIANVMVSCVAAAGALAERAEPATPSYQSDYAAYQAACEILPRPNVDCACVARAHATWAHMAPDRAYAAYLLALYRQRLGLPGNADAMLEAYFRQSSAKDELGYRANVAFDSIASADPFRDESVNGCVIPNAPKPQLGPLPAGEFYREVYPKMVSSLGHERLVQCQLIETSKLMSVAAFEARTRVGNLAAPTRSETASEVGARIMGLSLDEFEALVQQADVAYAKAGVTTLDPGAYCAALLAAEDARGEVLERFLRDAEGRAGPPVGLASVDVIKPRPPITRTLEGSVASMQAEAFAIAARAKAENADALAELEALRSGDSPAALSQTEVAQLETELKAMQAGVEAQKADSAASAADGSGLSQAELDAACARSGLGAAFCACFTPKFVSEIAPAAGPTAYMLAASALPDGFDPMQAIGFAQNMDMMVLMNISPKVDALVDACN